MARKALLALVLAGTLLAPTQAWWNSDEGEWQRGRREGPWDEDGGGTTPCQSPDYQPTPEYVSPDYQPPCDSPAPAPEHSEHSEQSQSAPETSQPPIEFLSPPPIDASPSPNDIVFISPPPIRRKLLNWFDWSGWSDGNNGNNGDNGDGNSNTPCESPSDYQPTPDYASPPDYQPTPDYASPDYQPTPPCDSPAPPPENSEQSQPAPEDSQPPIQFLSPPFDSPSPDPIFLSPPPIDASPSPNDIIFISPPPIGRKLKHWNGENGWNYQHGDNGNGDYVPYDYQPTPDYTSPPDYQPTPDHASPDYQPTPPCDSPAPVPQPSPEDSIIYISPPPFTGVGAGLGLSTSGDQIVDASGQVVTLKGLSWFGFNNGATMVDGLWDPTNALTFDFATIVYRMQLLGFNAIRLPFSFADLARPPAAKQSSTCTSITQADIVQSVIDPQYTADPNAAPPPNHWPDASQMPANTCNMYLPETSTLDRFVYVVQFLANAGFYVMIDDHTEDATPASDMNLWAAQWANLVQAISQDAVAAIRLIVDVLNEPDARGWGWDKMTSMYLTAMDAVYAINPSILFMVEGCGQSVINANWGDGFCTDLAALSNAAPNSAADPNPFFQGLFSKPYLNQVVVSPHIYGPTVTYQSTGYSGTSLWSRLSTSFGYLTTSGYTYNGQTKRFPIAIGEFGSKFVDPKDTQQWLPDLVAYFTNTGGAADGLHNPITSFFYWSWNANSGDTGGIVDDGWQNIQWQKIEYLQGLGLNPWYTGNAPAPTPTPQPTPPPAPSPEPSPIPPPMPVPSPEPAPQSPFFLDVPSPAPEQSPPAPDSPAPIPDSPFYLPVPPPEPMPSPEPAPAPEPMTSPCDPTAPSPAPEPTPNPPPSDSCAASVPSDKQYACDACTKAGASDAVTQVCLTCPAMTIASGQEWACAAVCAASQITSDATASSCVNCIASGNASACQGCLAATSDEQMQSCFNCAMTAQDGWACGNCLTSANPDQCLTCVASNTQPGWQCTANK